jgi:RNA polymerase sigma-70 factor (ECF subfamily)
MELMALPCDDVDRVLGRYRAFLETLKVIYIDPRLKRFFDMSDIVQITWLEVSRDLERIEGLDVTGRKRWLFTMFKNNLKDEIRKIPPVTLVSLEELRGAEGKSWCGLKEVLAAKDSSPSERAAKQEEELLLAEALSRLDPRQRDVLSLRRHGWKLKEIAEHLGCTTGSVAGLLHRGLKELPELLPHME